MTLNGSLAGLVAITAGRHMVSPVGAAVIGIVAAFGIEFIDKALKIDDPVGAIGVHRCCGAVGTVLTGLLATDGGVFYGGGFQFFGVQCMGVACVIAWVAVTMTVVFFLIDKTIGLRVSKEEEIAGLDIMEHGLASSYADFMPIGSVPSILGAGSPIPAEFGESVYQFFVQSIDIDPRQKRHSRSYAVSQKNSILFDEDALKRLFFA